MTMHLAALGARPCKAAASAMAPPGSTTSFRRRAAKATAARASSSVAVRPPDSRRWLIGKVISPGDLDSNASQIDFSLPEFSSRLPAVSERVVSSKSAGSQA